MAKTKIDDICAVCKQPLQEGKAIYFTLAEFTKTSLSRSYYNQNASDLEDEIRIKHLGSTKEHGGMHIECWNDIKRRIGM